MTAGQPPLALSCADRNQPRVFDRLPDAGQSGARDSAVGRPGDLPVPAQLRSSGMRRSTQPGKCTIAEGVE
jgi:hypothetical protein